MTAVASATFCSENRSMSKECCCCSKNDCVKDICTEYYDSGMREIYSDIILDTFNININLKESNKNLKQYICDPCIKQLKNAYSFKCNILKSYEAMVERMNKLKQEIKYESIQIQEALYEDGIDERDFCDGISDSKLELKTEIIRKRKKCDTKAKLCKKIDDIENTQKTSKIVINKYKLVAKSTILRKNSIKLISNSSIWVFNWSEGRFRCFCCKEPFSDINQLKEHTIAHHNIEEIEAKIQNSENNLVKVEVSDIFCKICRENFENLNSLIDHFRIHNIIIDGHILVPIKINNLKCQICNETHTNFHTLYLHMIKHYQTFICDKCGAGFYQKRHLKQHIRKNHEQNLKKARQQQEFKCNFCSERFKQFYVRIEHMVSKHGLEKPEFPCKLCNKIYLTKGILNAHVKNSHNIKEKVFECEICFKTFKMKSNLVRHKESHTDGLNYNCSVCNHGFKLKTSLRRHVKQKHKS